MSLFTQQLLERAFLSALVLVGILLNRASKKRLGAKIDRMGDRLCDRMNNVGNMLGGGRLDEALDNRFDDHLAGKLGLIANRLEELHKTVIDLKGRTDRN